MKKLEKWFYEFKYGHPRLITEEVDIILDVRGDDDLSSLDDSTIKDIIQIRVLRMYKERFPNAKKYSWSFLLKSINIKK